MFEGSTDLLKAFMGSKLMVSLVTNGVLATVGATANYLYALVNKGAKFHFFSFFVTAFLGFFIGNVVGNFLPSEFPYRDGTLLVAGFTCYPLLGMLEEKFPALFLRKVEQTLGLEPEFEDRRPPDCDPPGRF